MRGKFGLASYQSLGLRSNQLLHGEVMAIARALCHIRRHPWFLGLLYILVGGTKTRSLRAAHFKTASPHSAKTPPYATCINESSHQPRFVPVRAAEPLTCFPMLLFQLGSPPLPRRPANGVLVEHHEYDHHSRQRPRQQEGPPGGSSGVAPAVGKREGLEQQGATWGGEERR